MDHSIYKTKFQHMSAFLFPFSISCITLTLPLMLKTFLAFMTVAMLSHYQSPVKCRSRTAKVNFTHQGITVITVIVKAWNIYMAIWEGTKRWLHYKTVYFLENYIWTDDWQSHNIWGRCSYISCTRQGRKTCALWWISWYHRMYKVIARMVYKPRSS